MSFPRYPEYKDSGVEWLGQVPAHWAVKKLKHVSPELTVGIVIEPSKLYAEEGVPALRSLNVKAGAIELNNLVFITHAGHALHSKSKLNEGDIVVVRTGQPGTAAVIPQELDGCNCIDLIVIRRPVVGSEQFLCWYLESGAAVAQFSVGSGGAIQQHFNISTAAELMVALPPPIDQVHIAAFLDHETSKIDALVAEQERLIELLKEKRQAVISHAVTKGLNPDAPMKPSGVEWLGEVPEHWRVMSVKRDLAFITSGSRGWAENYAAEGELFIRIANLTRDGIGLDLSDIQRVAVPEGSEGERTRVKTGDVLFSITAFLGSIAVVSDALESAYVSQHIALARLQQKHISPKWLGYVGLSVVGKTWFERQSYGGTKIQLSLDDVRELPVPVPPVSEQCAIADYITGELSKLNALTTEAQRAIEFLQERRTALISAAVTGQIDVRALAHRSAA